MNSSNSKLSFARIVGGSFILIGSMFAIVGLIWILRTTTFVMRASKAPGTVVEMERGKLSHAGSTKYHPIFTFTDASGIIHTQRTSVGSSRYMFEPGEKVSVLYDCTAPKHSKIDSFQTVWLEPLQFTGFGLLFGGFACVWLYLATLGIRLEKEKYV